MASFNLIASNLGKSHDFSTIIIIVQKQIHYHNLDSQTCSEKRQATAHDETYKMKQDRCVFMIRYIKWKKVSMRS
jgi:hypothetical protein